MTNIIDWERKLKMKKNIQNTNRKKRIFSLEEAIFIKTILNHNNLVRSKIILRKEITSQGLDDEEFDKIYLHLKELKILNIRYIEPKGFYISKNAIDRVDKEYPESLNDLVQKLKEIKKYKYNLKHSIRKSNKINPLNPT